MPVVVARRVFQLLRPCKRTRSIYEIKEWEAVYTHRQGSPQAMGGTEGGVLERRVRFEHQTHAPWRLISSGAEADSGQVVAAQPNNRTSQPSQPFPGTGGGGGAGLGKAYEPSTAGHPPTQPRHTESVGQDVP